MESTSSRDAISGVHGPGWFFAKNVLDLLNANWDTCGFSNEFDKVDINNFEAYSIRNKLKKIL